jgi:hypothetical protein
MTKTDSNKKAYSPSTYNTCSPAVHPFISFCAFTNYFTNAGVGVSISNTFCFYDLSEFVKKSAIIDFWGEITI